MDERIRTAVAGVEAYVVGGAVRDELLGRDIVDVDVATADPEVAAKQNPYRGKTFAFLPQDSWMWQMHASIAVDDLTHENFWRQLLRWLVDGVPDQVEPSFTSERVEPGEAALLTAAVVDPFFVELNDAAVMVTVTSPLEIPGIAPEPCAPLLPSRKA